MISTFLRRILERQPIEIWGDGTVVRDYLEVGDLAEFCAIAGTSDHEGAYNAGSGQGLSVNEIIQAIRTTTAADFETIYKPSRPIDIPRSVLDCARAKNDFSWECTTKFESGLCGTWDWLKAQV